MRKPKVSIIMGVYNCQETVEESIESILHQTYKNWELIICDDASTDGTYEKVLPYTKHEPERIRLIRNTHNERLAASLNHCLAEASGELIARQDGDDLSVSTRLEKQVYFLETHPEYDVVGTAMTVFDESGTKGVRALVSEPNRKVLARGTPFCHGTIMMRASAYKDLNGYRSVKTTRRMEDIDLWIRFFAAGRKGFNLQEPLYLVREDEAAFQRRKFRYSMDNAWLVLKACWLLKLSPFDYLFALKPVARACLSPKIMRLYHQRKLEASMLKRRTIRGE
ncbi:glycosyltransferase family 2 protein [Bacillus zhangzhouensis]|uniref:glycosyltransferase family 2 protein n=1 Tax=Bacillus zhangzhouensis TaxID=1178540 RepID=UPI00281354DA|nr:glycosyltransferase [Bacillus zhangzhouensis]MDR0125587.1 glycosyltransferase [Bacillus zhangzhouensis]